MRLAHGRANRRRLRTSEVWVHFQGRPCEIFGGKRGIRIGSTKKNVTMATVLSCGFMSGAGPWLH
jgi:hypothetical protein